MLVSALTALVLFTVGAALYPGGNHFDRAAIGHDFWRNALCDVARSTAVGGAPNVAGAAFARTAMVVMAAGIDGLYWLLPERFPSRKRLALVVRALGVVTVPASIAVVLLTADRYSAVHGVAIMIAGFPGLGAGVLATTGLVLEHRGLRAVTALGVATFVVSAVDFGIYFDEVVSGGPSRMAVPVLERIAALLMVAWMVAASFRPPRGGSTAHVSGRVSGVTMLADYDAAHDESSNAPRRALDPQRVAARL